MPVIQSAKKKQRQDKKRYQKNQRMRSRYKDMIKKAKKKRTKKTIQTAYSAIDKAAKRHVIHKNKAARLKSILAYGTKS